MRYMILCLLLCGCTSSIATREYCEVSKTIKVSSRDTPETRRDVRAENAKRREFCDKSLKIFGTAK